MTLNTFLSCFPTPEELEKTLQKWRADGGDSVLIAGLGQILKLLYNDLVDYGYDPAMHSYPIRIVERVGIARFSIFNTAITYLPNAYSNGVNYWTNVFSFENLHSEISYLINKNKQNENNKVPTTPEPERFRSSSNGESTVQCAGSTITIASGQTFNGQTVTISQGKVKVSKGNISF